MTPGGPVRRDYRVWFPLFLSSLHNCECLSFIWPSQLVVIKASKYVQRKVRDWGSQRGEAETEGLIAARGVMGFKMDSGWYAFREHDSQINAWECIWINIDVMTMSEQFSQEIKLKTRKWKFCQQLLSPMMFQTRRRLFFQRLSSQSSFYTITIHNEHVHYVPKRTKTT